MKNTENGLTDEKFDDGNISDDSLESVSGGFHFFAEGDESDTDRKPDSFWEKLIAMDKGEPLSLDEDDEPSANANLI